MKIVRDCYKGLDVVTKIESDYDDLYLRLKITIKGKPENLINCYKEMPYKEFGPKSCIHDLLDDQIHFLCLANYGHMFTNNSFSLKG